MATYETDDARFMAKVQVDGEDHWLWTGALNDGGYAKWWFETKVLLGHRWAYERWRGPIPPDHVLDHLCKIHRCVNPRHVEPVPLNVNTERGDSITAQNKRKDSCKWGHPLSGSNLYQAPGKSARLCRTCLRDNNRRHYQRHPDQFKTKNDAYRGRNPNYDKRRYQVQKSPAPC